MFDACFMALMGFKWVVVVVMVFDGFYDFKGCFMAFDVF